MKIEFESAVLSPVSTTGQSTISVVQTKKPKIGWFLQTTDVTSASARYRCLHFARILSGEFQNAYFTSLPDVQVALVDLDALIIVKRLDRAVVELVGAAKLFGVPTFLDLCDDLISPAYAKNQTGMNLIHFLGIAPLVAGITVPSPGMADRIEGYANKHGLTGLSIHVIPDIAETWDIYRATAHIGEVTHIPSGLYPRPKGGRPADRKRVVWFGNYGASHSDFGIFSLKPVLKPLRTVHHDIPLELVIISNSEPVYKALVRDCGFPTRYVPWSAQAVYSELANAHAALLTTGDDEFCSIKSSNRVLQALAAGVPVITSKGAALAEFEDVIFSGRIEESLRLCLGPKHLRIVPERLETARTLLARYTPERLGGIWGSLLRSAIQVKRAAEAGKPRKKILIVLEPGDSPSLAKKLVSVAKQREGLEYELLVSTELLESQADFSEVLAKASVPPRFFSGTLKARRNLLLGAAAIIVERPSAPVGKTLSDFARDLGIRVFSSIDACNGSLDEVAAKGAPSAPRLKGSHAGPYEERLNADGSVDWSFVVHQNARGWILDAICREIGSRQPRSWKVSYYPESMPVAKNIFFSHYVLLQNVLERRLSEVENSKVFVWYTHPRVENPVTAANLLAAFDQVTKVIFACESNRRIWIERGLARDKTAVVLGAADPALFRFHERGCGVVGLSSSFYERKNPDGLLEVIRLLPHRQFVLVGRKWHQYALFEEMKALPNFTYKSSAYHDYPDIYSSFDVFLSMSKLEGGPIPLVEAMMSNAVPVASRTGFAPDLIKHGDNGYIFDLDASPVEIAQLIEAAFALHTNVRETVECYHWDNFSSEIVKLAQ
jgi:glycosyltransferase involved in cell wall biosynthesis